MNSFTDQHYKLLNELNGVSLGSFDLFDFLVRLRVSNDLRQEKEILPLFSHERLHYTQIVATKVGFGHLLLLNELTEKLYYLALETDHKPPYLRYLNPQYQGKDSDVFNRISEILNEHFNVWRYVEINELPTLKFPISQAADHKIHLDVNNGCIYVGNSTAINVGLQLICENMAKISDYHVRILNNLYQLGILDAVKRDGHTIPYGPNYSSLFKQHYGVSLEKLLIGSIPTIGEKTGLLYDLPLLYALQEDWKFPFESAPIYALMCGWILLFDETWMPDARDGIFPSQIGNRYLAMLKHGKEIAEQLISDANMTYVSKGGLNLIKVADIICEYFKMRPFSASVAEWNNYLVELRESLINSLPEGSKDIRSLPILWFIEDGIETLNIFSQFPMQFFHPLPYFSNNKGEEFFVVGPPTCCTDTWTSNNKMDPYRVLYHLQRAILKELLFSKHSFSETDRRDEISTCIFKENCIFADEGAKELVTYAMLELVEVRKHFGIASK